MGAGLRYSRNDFACATWPTLRPKPVRRTAPGIRRRPWDARIVARLPGCVRIGEVTTTGRRTGIPILAGEAPRCQVHCDARDEHDAATLRAHQISRHRNSTETFGVASSRERSTTWRPATLWNTTRVGSASRC